MKRRSGGIRTPLLVQDAENEPGRAKTRAQTKHALAGFSLPECLISIGLALPVVFSAISLLLVTTEQQVLCEQLLIMEQDAQFALEVISRAIEQAGHQDVLLSGAPPPSAPAVDTVPPLTGLDNASMNATSDPLSGPTVSGLMGSDVLIAHFAGTGMLNCAGLALTALSSDSADLGYSVFYVARGAGTEPELRCKYLSASGWVSEPLIAGVESLHFLFGVDRDADGLPDQYMNASAIRAEQSTRPAGVPSLWDSVVAVKVSLLMRSARTIRKASAAPSHLFGASYSQIRGGKDKGTQVSVSDFPDDQRMRLRRVFEHLVFLRNPRSLVQPGLIEPYSAMKSADTAAAAQ